MKSSYIYTDNSENWYLPRLLILFSSHIYIYTHTHTPKITYLHVLFYCRETSTNPSKRDNKPRAMAVQSLLSLCSCHKRHYHLIQFLICQKHKKSKRICILFLTLQQCEKIWHMYSCVYRDLLSSAMRWEITVASWKQARKERSIKTISALFVNSLLLKGVLIPYSTHFLIPHSSFPDINCFRMQHWSSQFHQVKTQDKIIKVVQEILKTQVTVLRGTLAAGRIGEWHRSQCQV